MPNPPDMTAIVGTELYLLARRPRLPRLEVKRVGVILPLARVRLSRRRSHALSRGHAIERAE